MPFRWNPKDHLSHIVYAMRWALIVLPVGLLVGSACAMFLWTLQLATNTRHDNPWLLFLLPVCGLVVGGMYQLWGKSVEAGNNLIMDEIHKPGGGVPFRMAPLVLIGTVFTHLFGGSAGREGTAVQMGGSIASYCGSKFKFLSPNDQRILLMAGVAAGFGGVFGTPLAGAIFAIEVLAIGKMSYAAVIPCLMASILSDWACGAWGVHHTVYHFLLLSDNQGLMRLDWMLLVKASIAAVAFGLTAHLFAELTHGLGKVFKRTIPWPAVRPFVGGLIVIAMVYALGTRDYLGLGVTSPDVGAVTILSSFTADGATPWSWWWKLLFTAVTLGAGFKGGEVTPLFFIGAALGNTLSWLLGAPVELFAALGFVAVFAGATNTPLACTIMAVELFGTHHVVYFAVACFGAYLFSGHNGIYLSQRVGTPKADTKDIAANASLRSERDKA